MKRHFRHVVLGLLFWSPSQLHAGEPGTAAIRTARELHSLFSNATGISPIADAIQAQFQGAKYQFSSGGAVTDISAPMLMQMTTLASLYCDALITKESRQPAIERLIFNDVDFALGVIGFTPAVRLSVSKKLGEAFWRRTVKPEELQELGKLIESIGVGSKDSSTTLDEMLLGLCTAVGASLESLAI